MTYKMERKQGTFEKGDNGIGKIRFSKQGNKVQILVRVSIGKDQFEEKEFILNKDDCPDNIDLAKNAKDWMIQMSGQGDRLMSFRPVQGAFVVTTQSFASKEGEEPTPKTREVDFMKDSKHIKYSYDYFTVLLEVLEPDKFKGLTIPLILRYQLSEFVKEGKSIAGFSMSGKYTDQLEEYLLVAGVLEDNYQPLEWKDNLLPTLQRIALHEGKHFQATMKDGWIVPGSLIPYDEPNAEDVPWDEDQTELDKRVEEVANPKPEFEAAEEMDFEPEE